MKLLHNVQISVFEKDKDGLVLDTLHKLIPDDWQKEKIELEKKNVTGMDGDPIETFNIYLEKQRHLKGFIGILKKGLGKMQLAKLQKQKRSRLDETLHFYLRLDKTSLEKGTYKLTDSGECYHIKMSVAAFPKSVTNGLKVIDELFS